MKTEIKVATFLANLPLRVFGIVSNDLLLAIPEQDDLRSEARVILQVVLDFAVSDIARYHLMFTRAIPGFEPSPESYAPSVEAVKRVLSRFAHFGVTDTAAVDLWTGIVAGLASQQIANEPDGDRWIRLGDETVDMYCNHLEKSGRIKRPRPAKGAKR